MTAATAADLARLTPDARKAVLADLSPAELETLNWSWEFWRQPHQVPPEPPWRVWALIAGRGSGKSWTGAQWVRSEIESGRRRSIALISPTHLAGRKIMVEDSLLRLCPPHAMPVYEMSTSVVRWPNGGVCHLLSSETPDRARGNTRIGRQELLAEMLTDVPGALWSQAMLDDHRVAEAPTTLRRLIVGVDPSGGGSAETGIIVCGRATNGHAYVLADRSVRGSPETWGKRSVAAYHEYRADKIVCERNFGGDMITDVIRNIDLRVAVKLVTASRGKAVRAEPVVACYEQGKVHHVGVLPVLEDQLVSWDPDSNDPSPDRLDALVWCITELVGDAPMQINPKALQDLRAYGQRRAMLRGY